MRVLLLGGTGFLGNATCRRLRGDGHQVVVASRSTAADVSLDATDDLALATYLAANEFDCVVNLLGAGLSAGSADEYTMRLVNSILPARILDLLDEVAPHTHFVHAASSTERLPGQRLDESAYSRTKHEGTTALLSAADGADVPLTVLTVHNTYGPHQPNARFIAHTIGVLREGRRLILNYPDRERDFVFIDDVAACIARTVTQTPPGLDEAQVGTGIGITLREAALVIADALGQDPALVESEPHHLTDPNPATVCPIPGGTFGLCTTTFDAGIVMMVDGVGKVGGL
jgi:nucleoside-diphosphate-sugar epimerase